MKNLLNLITLSLLFTSSLGFAGGAGGFSGNSDLVRKYGDLRNGVGIWFQKQSTFVNAVYNDTLCLNQKNDRFEARVNLKKHRGVIYQDRVSLAETCNDSRCNDLEWKKYVQKQEQWGEFSKSDRGHVRRIKVRIPNCHQLQR